MPCLRLLMFRLKNDSNEWLRTNNHNIVEPHHLGCWCKSHSIINLIIEHQRRKNIFLIFTFHLFQNFSVKNPNAMMVLWPSSKYFVSNEFILICPKFVINNIYIILSPHCCLQAIFFLF